MKCPHCLTTFHEAVTEQFIGEDATSHWTFFNRTCPACRKFVISLQEKFDRYRTQNIASAHYHKTRHILCYPRAISRSPLSASVPEEFSSDYREACITLIDSPKASAALSRRCLQHLLREVAKVKASNLADEIQQVIDSGRLPSHLVDSLDAIRNIGNFAAHPIKGSSRFRVGKGRAAARERGL